MSELAFFIDYARCIGCQACVQACEECDTHRGRSMIHLETIAGHDSVQTAPQVCMRDMLAPAAIGSLVLCGANALLLRYVIRFDAAIRSGG